MTQRYKLPKDDINFLIAQAIVQYRSQLIENDETDEWRVAVIDKEIFNPTSIKFRSGENPIDTAYVGRYRLDFGVYYGQIEQWRQILEGRGCYMIAADFYVAAKRQLNRYGPFAHALTESEFYAAMEVLDFLTYAYQNAYQMCSDHLLTPTDPHEGGGGNVISAPPLPPMGPAMSIVLTDCNAVSIANKITNIPQFKNTVDSIKNKNKEWGANIKLVLLYNPNSIEIEPIYTENKERSIKPRFSWDSTRGYHIGFIHNHPNNSAPSPSDLYNAALNMDELVNFGVTNQELGTYIVSYTSSIVSGDYIYTIVMKSSFNFNWMKGSFDQNTENKLYKDIIDEYLDDNLIHDPTTDQMQEAGEYALLRLYGDQVHIVKRKINDPNGSKLLKRQNNQVTQKNGC